MAKLASQANNDHARQYDVSRSNHRGLASLATTHFTVHIYRNMSDDNNLGERVLMVYKSMSSSQTKELEVGGKGILVHLLHEHRKG